MRSLGDGVSTASDRVRARLKAWSGRLGTTREERAIALATVILVVLGLWLRARGFLYNASAFWVDECTWAVMLMELPLTELLIRPPGFMAVNKLLALVFGPTETALRTLSWVSAIALTLFSPALARRLFRAPAARLLFVAIIALHPAATSFAKEYKPYAVSLTLHLALVWLTLRYVANRGARELAWVLGVAFVGGLFAQDLVFAFPGVFLVVGYDALRNRRRHLPAIGISASVIVGALAAQYVFIWSKLAAEESDFWGKKYRVFYTGRGTYFEWLVERYRGLTSFPGYHMNYWDASWLSADGWSGFQNVAVVIWLILHVTGVAVLLFRKRHYETLLVLLPIGVVWLFNLAGKWPFGLFRANLFLVGYTAAIAGMAFDGPRVRFALFQALAPATLLVVAPLLWFEDGWGPTKRALTYTSRFPEMVVWLAEQHRERSGQREVLLVDRKDCDMWRYYAGVSPRLAPLRPALAGFDVRCVPNDKRLLKTTLKTLRSGESPVWVLFSVREGTKAVLEAAHGEADVLAKGATTGHTAIGFVPRGNDAGARALRPPAPTTRRPR